MSFLEKSGNKWHCRENLNSVRISLTRAVDFYWYQWESHKDLFSLSKLKIGQRDNNN